MNRTIVKNNQLAIKQIDSFEQRRESRITLPAVLFLRRKSNSAGYRREAVTENVSRNGARVMLDVPLPIDAEVEVSAFGGQFKASAVVCHVEGGDGLWLIGLRFKRMAGKWIVG